MSEEGRIMRPNGKLVPMGVLVGPGMRLLTPYGTPLPDGIKVRAQDLWGSRGGFWV